MTLPRSPFSLSLSLLAENVFLKYKINARERDTSIITNRVADVRRLSPTGSRLRR